MPSIDFDQVTKKFGEATAVDHISLHVEDNELLVLLGPSGCGKSTLLRMIAGLAPLTSGAIYFDGERIDNLHPMRRDVAFVFQSYALYPHMTVRENMAFPLVMRDFKWFHHLPFVSGIRRRIRQRDPVIRDRVEQTASLLELGDFLDRTPKTLSGGQRQRVAVGRAMVREPRLYLMDEPLSNLDAKLRTQMRSEIVALYERFSTTCVYVTHDQVEAMTMGTKIAVMRAGQIQQFGTPREIYSRPKNTFVAQFIGSPPMNILSIDIREDQVVLPGGHEIRLPPSWRGSLPEAGVSERRFQLGVRPEGARLLTDLDSDTSIPVVVSFVEDLGAERLVTVNLTGSGARGLVVHESDEFKVRSHASDHPAPGDHAYMEIDSEEAVLFDAEGARLYAPELATTGTS